MPIDSPPDLLNMSDEEWASLLATLELPAYQPQSFTSTGVHTSDSTQPSSSNDQLITEQETINILPDGSGTWILTDGPPGQQGLMFDPAQIPIPNLAEPVPLPGDLDITWDWEKEEAQIWDSEKNDWIVLLTKKELQKIYGQKKMAEEIQKQEKQFNRFQMVAMEIENVEYTPTKEEEVEQYHKAMVECVSRAVESALRKFMDSADAIDTSNT